MHSHAAGAPNRILVHCYAVMQLATRGRPSPRNLNQKKPGIELIYRRACVRVPYHKSEKNLVRSSGVVLALPCFGRGRSWTIAMSCWVSLRRMACKVQEVCERISTCNCLVKIRLATLRQAERTRQPKPGSDFQMRRKDEAHD
jgi:hypothetical protein